MTTRMNQSALNQQLAEAKRELHGVASELADLFGSRLDDPDLPPEQRAELETATRIIENIKRLCAL